MSQELYHPCQIIIQLFPLVVFDTTFTDVINSYLNKFSPKLIDVDTDDYLILSTNTIIPGSNMSECRIPKPTGTFLYSGPFPRTIKTFFPKMAGRHLSRDRRKIPFSAYFKQK